MVIMESENQGKILASCQLEITERPDDTDPFRKKKQTTVGGERFGKRYSVRRKFPYEEVMETSHLPPYVPKLIGVIDPKKKEFISYKYEELPADLQLFLKEKDVNSHRYSNRKDS